MMEQARVTTTGDADDLGRQPFTSVVGDRAVDLHGFPCDHIAHLQSTGHDVLVVGEVQVLPYGKYGYPDPVETPEGMLYRADDSVRVQRPRRVEDEPRLSDRASALRARLDALDSDPLPQPPGLAG